MAQKTRFLNEFDPFKNYQDITIENLKDLDRGTFGRNQKRSSTRTSNFERVSVTRKSSLTLSPRWNIEWWRKGMFRATFLVDVFTIRWNESGLALKVLKNYLSMMKDRPQYFEVSYSPYRLDMIYQQMVRFFSSPMLLLFFL